MSTYAVDKPKLTFSGHDTFHCRHLWLKKGYDFVKKAKKFSDENAVIELGVGKNMVSAIHFWLKAFGVIDKSGQLTEFAHYIFADNLGKDPFLEDTATLWLLHYKLVTSEHASIYNLIFNDLRKEKIEFSKISFLNFIERKCEELSYGQFNRNTVSTDFDVMTKLYIRTIEQSKDKEDTISGLLTDLNLVQEEKRKSEEMPTYSVYSISNDIRNDIPSEVILYTILDSDTIQKSVSLNSIFQDRNKASSAFAITKSSLLEKLETIIKEPSFEKYGITLSDHAGIKELQFNEIPSGFDILNNYYGN